MNSGRSDLRDADWVQQRCEQVLGQALYWFPVRHHSPAVARHVEAAILARRPKLVFLEGPSEANSPVPYLVDSQTKPPVAIYSSYRDDDNVLGLAGIASPAADVPAILDRILGEVDALPGLPGRLARWGLAYGSDRFGDAPESGLGFLRARAAEAATSPGAVDPRDRLASGALRATAVVEAFLAMKKFDIAALLKA